jgi:hypothetical protein
MATGKYCNFIDVYMIKIMQCGPLFAAMYIVCVLNGCSGRQQTGSETAAITADSAATALTDQVCYRQVTGRDTTLVRLTISGTAVTGELDVLPAEKDRATGQFSGIRTNDQVAADWQRSGEGVTQVYQVNFTMAGDSLLWREGERVEKQGKWVLVNPDAGFQYVLTRVDCP